MNPNWCWCVFKSVLLSVSILIFVSEIHMCFYCFLSHLSGFGIAIRKRIGKLQKKKQKKPPQNLMYLCFCCSVVSWVRLSVTPWTEACQSSLSITSSQSLLKFRFVQPVTPSYHLILCRSLLLLPLTFPSIRVFVF